MFFAASAAWFVDQAANVRRGVVLDGLIHLDRGQARTFYEVLAGLSLGLVALGTYSLLWVMRRTRQLDLDDDGITVPGRPLWPLTTRILWQHITSARLKKFNGHVSLAIDSSSGKRWIAKTLYTDRDFDEIVEIVAAHVPAPRSELPTARVHS